MSWMQTYTGGKFYVRQMGRTQFDLKDIAHALSNLCRFGGHTRGFYSVAQHSILVADIVRANGGTLLEELWGLMHDATEAYMIDVPTPIKVTLEGYEEREHRLMRLIADALDMPAHREKGLLPVIVKSADRVALVTEARQLVHGTSEWTAAYNSVPSHPVSIQTMTPAEAERAFLKRYTRIMKALGAKAGRCR